MREHERIDRIINLIRAIWKLQPDQRLGQLLMNYAFEVESNLMQIYNREDDRTEFILTEWLKRLQVNK